MSRFSDYEKAKNVKQIHIFNELKNRLPEYTHLYLDDKRRSNQMSTAIQYAYDLLSFFEYFGNDVDINSLTYIDINDYQDYLEAGGIRQNSNSSIKRKMAAIHGFFIYGVSHGIVDSDPVSGASVRKRNKENAIVYMSLDEVNELIKTVNKGAIGSQTQQKHLKHYRFRDTAILTLFLNTGIRVSELVGLDLDDINFKENYIIILRKGGKEQTIYFNDSVSIALQDYIEFERITYATDSEPALFLSSHKKRLSIHSVQNIVTKYTKSSVQGKHITAHKLRSTYGTNLYQSTNDIRLTADVLGHSDINTTAKYYASQSNENRKKAGRIDLYN